MSTRPAPAGAGKCAGRQFAGCALATAVRNHDSSKVRWEELKAVEKRRDSALDGVAQAQPAAALVAKYLARARRAGVP